MKDDLDRQLELLPRPLPAADLARRVAASVRQRHRRRIALRRLTGVAFATCGLVLALPGLGWITPGLFSSGLPWLFDGVGALESGSLPALQGMWSGLLDLQAAASASFAASVWLGLVFLSIGLLAAVDRRVFLPPWSL